MGRGRHLGLLGLLGLGEIEGHLLRHHGEHVGELAGGPVTVT